ncbi:alpha/beta hydrolase [Kribbella sp. NBC_00482]|uniref:alpha/beta fold hydrolase n=1 Tax=Kribbella sp. NBC_00482 TaxID=2975968 RepID=UPI002E19A830
MNWQPPQTYEVGTPDGRVLQYCVYGATGGVPVIAHHGTPGCRWERPDVIAAIEDTGLRMVVPGRPGYGSTRSPGRSVADVAADTQLLADAQGWDRFAVTGFSGGGPHALACAALLPDRIVNCSTVAGIAAPGTAALESLDWVPDARRGEGWLRERLHRRGREILDHFDPATPDGRYQRMLTTCVEGLDGWIDDYLALTRPWGFAPESISVPVDVWYGLDDDNTTFEHTEWLLATIPAARRREFAGGHDPNDIAQRQIFRALTA